MGRRRRGAHYVLVYGDDLGCVSKAGEFRRHSDEDVPDDLLDELQCPVADEVLIALRKAYSLTFPYNHLMDGLQESLAEIRRVSAEALVPLGDVLAELGLSPVPATMDDKMAAKVYVFKFVFARTDDLKRTVRYRGKDRSLLRLVQQAPADDLISTLRAVLSDTFAEAYDEEQHSDLLRRIRERIVGVLPSYNQQLFEIEVELIEVPEIIEEVVDD
jgi:hypothetical protein